MTKLSLIEQNSTTVILNTAHLFEITFDACQSEKEMDSSVCDVSIMASLKDSGTTGSTVVEYSSGRLTFYYGFLRYSIAVQNIQHSTIGAKRCSRTTGTCATVLL